MKHVSIIAITLLLPFTAFAQSPEQAINKLQDTHKKLELQRVIDGDTIEASGKTIRLWGIDAPESHTDYGPMATEFLKSFLKGSTIKCKFIEKDRYDRDVMHCLSDGMDIGSIMVQTGMAEDFSRYSGDYYDYEEGLAKDNERGLWREN